ncbi:serine/threonine-protein phosphatase 6 regulatory ankyrin repeat subunit B-like isoform X2 [Mytilus trossulus]
MFRLMSNVAPKAVRDTFDQHFPPSNLASRLAKDKLFITQKLFYTKVINRKQMDLLYPASGNTSSENYDVTLMICLLRNLSTIVPPSNGYDQMPPATEISDGSDLARIKYYRNQIVHAEKDEIAKQDFTIAWACVSKAIVRLGGITYKSVCDEVSQMNLNKDILTFVRQDLTEFKKEIGSELKKLENQTDHIQTNVTMLKDDHEKFKDAVKITTLDLFTKISEYEFQDDHIDELSSEFTKQIQDLSTEIKDRAADTIPVNIRSQNDQYINEWIKDDSEFIVTRAAKHVAASIQLQNCVVVTGSSGTGKSSIIHHVALNLFKQEGYEIISLVTGPSDIIHYRDLRKKQVFVIDDICGKETVNIQTVYTWKDHLEKIEKIFKAGENDKRISMLMHNIIPGNPAKLLISCRLHVFKDLQFQQLNYFASNECNIVSQELCLLLEERKLMINQYISNDMSNHIETYLENFDFFPLLCKLSKGKSLADLTKLFTAPVNTIKDELMHIIRFHNKIPFCAIVLCVLFEDGFSLDLLKLKTSSQDTIKLKSVCAEFDIDVKKEMSRTALRECLANLEGTYLKRRVDRYTLIHDKIYEIAAVICGQHLQECFIKFAPSEFIRDHYIFESFKDRTSCDENLIVLSKDMIHEYFVRLILDLKNNDLKSIFHNKQLRFSSFRLQLLSFFKRNLEVTRLLLAFDRRNRRMFYGYSSVSTPTPLMEAVTEGYVDMVLYLIDINCDVNEVDSKGRSTLYIACEGGHTDVVKLLLERNVDVSKRGSFGMSPLYLASERGYTDIVKLLLDNNAAVSQTDDFKQSPFYMACKGGHSDIVKLLLAKKADMSQREKLSGMSGLLVACELGHVDTVRMLVENNADILHCDVNKRSVLYMACKKGFTAIVKLLLENNCNISQCNNRGQSPLSVACKSGYVDIVKLFLEKQIDISKCDRHGQSPLYLAVQQGHTDIVKLLLQTKANVSQRGWSRQTPLYVACEKGHTPIVKILLQSGADVSHCGKFRLSPLHVACIAGHTGIVKLLLKNNSDLHQCDKFGKSSLYHACKAGHSVIVKMLLEKNADVSQCDKHHQSPLFIACEGGHTESVKLLLPTNVDVAKRDTQAQSALHVACRNGHTSIVELLLESKAKVSQYCWARQTPCFFACKGGHIDILTLLLKENADILECNKYKQSPLYVAAEGGHTDIVTLLLENNADVFQLDKNGQSALYIACKGGHTKVVEHLLSNNDNVSEYDRCCKESSLYAACVRGHEAIVKL